LKDFNKVEFRSIYLTAQDETEAKKIAQILVWEKLVASRKKPLKQAAMLGFDTLFLIITRLITIQGLEKKVSGRLGIDCRTLLTPYAEMGMDVDKLFQLQIVEKFLAKRVTK